MAIFTSWFWPCTNLIVISCVTSTHACRSRSRSTWTHWRRNLDSQVSTKSVYCSSEYVQTGDTVTILYPFWMFTCINCSDKTHARTRTHTLAPLQFRIVLRLLVFTITLLLILFLMTRYLYFINSMLQVMVFVFNKVSCLLLTICSTAR